MDAPNVFDIAPELHKVEFENDKVRIIKSSLPAGYKLPLHQHPRHLTIVIKGSKLRISLTNGEAKEIDVADGTISEGNTIPHAVENIGSSAIEEYFVEFK